MVDVCQADEHLWDEAPSSEFSANWSWHVRCRRCNATMNRESGVIKKKCDCWYGVRPIPDTGTAKNTMGEWLPCTTCDGSGWITIK